jgi:hypothetical protein
MVVFSGQLGKLFKTRSSDLSLLYAELSVCDGYSSSVRFKGVQKYHLREQEQEITEDDLVHLSPARFEHINIYGKYSFDISVP